MEQPPGNNPQSSERQRTPETGLTTVSATRQLWKIEKGGKRERIDWAPTSGKVASIGGVMFYDVIGGKLLVDRQEVTYATVPMNPRQVAEFSTDESYSHVDTLPRIESAHRKGRLQLNLLSDASHPTELVDPSQYPSLVKYIQDPSAIGYNVDEKIQGQMLVKDPKNGPDVIVSFGTDTVRVVTCWIGAEVMTKGEAWKKIGALLDTPKKEEIIRQFEKRIEGDENTQVLQATDGSFHLYRENDDIILPPRAIEIKVDENTGTARRTTRSVQLPPEEDFEIQILDQEDI